ncbi:MAG: ATP-binding protein [Hyalangium sp.]|uniref:ATP-binding protein n=1 Tax=Hyalangium sp. TaxID=2028555 RepID=UPI00389AE1D8
MTRTGVPEAEQARTEPPGLPSPPPTRPGLAGGLLTALDSLLSPALRQGSPSDLARSRVMAAATCFMFLFAVTALAMFPFSATSIILALVGLGYGATAVLMRHATSHERPALLLCASLAFGCMILPFFMKDVPYVGTHGALTLLPAISVYLMGARRGFFLTLLLCLGDGLLYPLSYRYLGPGAHAAPGEFFWPLYGAIIIALLGSWGLSALHSAARSEAQHSLEQTLAVLRDSESKLSSLFESTNDLMASLDTEGRVITANSAAKKAYRIRFGQELQPGQSLFHESDPQLRADWMPRLAAVLEGKHQRIEEVYTHHGVRLTFDTSVHPIHGEGGRITGMTIVARNITTRKEAELRLGEMHRTLVDISRQAGMAEIATGVLHNVGNTLNSVNVSTTLVMEQLRKTRLAGLGKASALLQEHAAQLASFLTEDPTGRKLPAYLSALYTQLQEEHEHILKEMRSLSDSVAHIKSIVSMQQKHARSAGAVEELAVPQLIDEALRLHALSFGRMGIQVERDYADVPPQLVDRHRLLQILVNLLSNARDALMASTTQDKRLRISIPPIEEGRLRIQVTDNGMGIAPENLPRMFSQGFTTKKEGHGFGLHISALAAMEMKGRLTCSSPGVGQGATFTLELPVEAPAA